MPTGLTTQQTRLSVPEATRRILAQINTEGWHLFAHIDHAKVAHQRGLSLRPTELILFGNPEIGTHLMQDQQISAIDLPMKILVWEDANQNVHITSNHTDWLKTRHNLTDNTTLDAIARVSERVCAAGTKLSSAT